MVKSLFFFFTGLLLSTFGRPVLELTVNKPPTREEARSLNHDSKEYEVFFNAENKVVYRDYDYHRIKGAELPFEIVRKPEERIKFGGRQVNVKVENGWLVGFDKGEWGGVLLWFNEEGTNYEIICMGNINNIHKVEGHIYVTEGLAHLSMSEGQILKAEKMDGKWHVEKIVDLPSAPYSSSLTEDNCLLIVTSHGLILLDDNFEITSLMEEGFWAGYLYPNSILIDENSVYIGMPAGILKTQLDDFNKQQWLTE